MIKTHTDKEVVDMLEEIYKMHLYAYKTAADGPYMKNESMNASKRCIDLIITLQQDYLDRCGLI